MRKRFFVLALLLCSVNVIYPQVLIALVFGKKLNTDKLEFGLTVSPSITNISNIESKYRPILDLGLYFNIKMNQNFFLHPEVIAKSAYGAGNIPVYATGKPELDSLMVGGNIDRKLKGWSIPLLVHYRIKQFLFAEIGPQIDWMLFKSQDVFKNKVDGDKLTYSKTISSEITNFSFGFAAGLIYKLRKDKGMGLGIRYYYGVTDIMKTVPGNQGHRMWMFNICIPVGTGKSSSTTNKAPSS